MPAMKAVAYKPGKMHTKASEKKESMKVERGEGKKMEAKERKMGVEKFKCGGAVKKGK